MNYLESKIKELCYIPITKKEETKKLYKIAEERVNTWQHIRLRSRVEDRWLIDDQLELWYKRLNKCRVALKYYKALEKAKKDEKKGIFIKRPVDYNINLIKQIPLKDMAERYGYRLTKAGINRYFFKLRQNERTPSCCIDTSKNTYHDFGGDEYGDVIDFVMKREGCEFREACKILNNLI